MFLRMCFEFLTSRVHSVLRRKHPSLGPARCYLPYARSGLLLRSFNRRVDPSRWIDIVDRWLSWGWFSTPKGKMESATITMKRNMNFQEIFLKPPFLFFHVLVSYSYYSFRQCTSFISGDFGWPFLKTWNGTPDSKDRTLCEIWDFTMQDVAFRAGDSNRMYA